MQYVVVRQQCKGKPLVHFHDNTDNFSIVYSYISANNNRNEGSLFLRFHGNNGYANAPQCELVHTLHTLSIFFNVEMACKIHPTLHVSHAALRKTNFKISTQRQPSQSHQNLTPRCTPNTKWAQILRCFALLHTPCWEYAAERSSSTSHHPTFFISKSCTLFIAYNYQKEERVLPGNNDSSKCFCFPAQ
jgi:hypothetical protein